MIIALLKTRTVCLTDIATALSGKPVLWILIIVKRAKWTGWNRLFGTIIYTAWKSQFL